MLGIVDTLPETGRLEDIDSREPTVCIALSHRPWPHLTTVPPTYIRQCTVPVAPGYYLLGNCVVQLEVITCCALLIIES